MIEGESATLRGVIVQQLLVALIWGGTWIAGRLVASEMPALAAASWRFLLGGLTLGFLVWRAEGRLPPLGRADLLAVIVLGAVGVFAYNLCFFYGLQHIQAGRGALVVALNPVAVALGAALLMGERLSPLRNLGVAIALLGCLFVIGRGNPLSLLRGEVGVGEIAIVGCVFAWAAYTLLGRRLTRTLSPLTMTFYAAVAGGLMLFAAGLIHGELRQWPQASPAGWFALGYLGILGSGLSYVWYAKGVQRLGATRAAAFINLVPVFAVAMGAVLLGERIGLATLAGGVLVLAGVALTNRPARRTPA
ncbi:DMT family transporter [Niveibacterium sp. SC-1]|uniref:DMT family transporter n=1 Tax=Niveibacterium sp. SC-1 TaxID=3135646 RepID=UPI00311EE992